MAGLRYLSASAMRQAVSRADVEEARTLAAYLDDNPSMEIAVGTVPLAHLRGTYSRRLRRCQRSEGPVCHGLVRFVETLQSDGEAELFVVRSAATAWVGLLCADGSLLDVTSVDRQAVCGYDRAG